MKSKVKQMFQVYDPDGNALYDPFWTHASALYMATMYAPAGSIVIEVEVEGG